MNGWNYDDVDQLPRDVRALVIEWLTTEHAE